MAELLFAERLKALRTEKGMTQVELGQRLGYGYTAIANYESGRNQPSLADLNSICEILEVSADYIIGRSEIRQPFVLLEKNDVVSLYEQAAVLAAVCRRCLQEKNK